MPPPPPPQAEEQPTIGPFPVKLQDVARDGDCFFNSIIQASRNQGILHVLEACIQRPATIQNLRNFTSDTIPEDTINGLFDSLYTNYKPNISLPNIERTQQLNTYKLLKESLSGWHVTAFENSVNNTGTRELAKAEFYKRIKAGIKEMTQWADQIEVTHLITILGGCNININIYYTETPGELYKKDNGVYQIHLFNERTVHYQFFKFTTRGGKRITYRNRKTRKQQQTRKHKQTRKSRN